MKKIIKYLLICTVFFGCKENKENENFGLIVPEGYTIERAVAPELISYPMFASFDEEGNLFVFESTGTNDMGTDVMLDNPSYQIRRLKDIDGDGEFDESVVFADKLPFPMGGEFHNGSLYVAASPDLLKLTDMDGDGISDNREVVLTGWKLNQNGAILSGPFMGKDGWMYLADARRSFDILSKEGERLKGDGTRIWRCKPDGSGLEWVSGGGFDNAIEIAFMPTGESIGTMTYFTDPRDGQRDALMHWVEGGVYPKDHPSIIKDSMPRTGPLMPVMTKMARVAPSGLMRYESGQWGKEFHGNLFTAEFNTGRVMRYKVEPEGATYSTEEEVFISSLERDIHPTDVLEDGDGSLLVIVTGGWFIEGCPLSRVAKPEVRGGIYRIYKNDTKKTNWEVAWGRGLDFEGMPLDQLAELLEDKRFKVAERAREELIQRGEVSVDILRSVLEEQGEEVRIDVIFSLYRIGGEKAIKIIRSALGDDSENVRIAATRCLGLERDESSIPPIVRCLESEYLPLRRQSATALGQIGSSESTASLLKALDGSIDRMTEHSIRYALYEMGAVEQLQVALKENIGASRRAALIALDQIQGYTLAEKDIFPFLSGDNLEDRELGVWIASRHPEWSSMIEKYLSDLLGESKFKNSNKGELEQLLLSFSGNSGVQKLMGHSLEKGTPEEQMFILDIIRRSNVSRFPILWKDKIKTLITHGAEEVRFSALGLVESLGLDRFNSELTSIVNDKGLGNELRLKAFSSRLMTDNTISGNEWKYLKGLISTENESMIRQEAVQLLSRAKLDNGQLIDLAQSELPRADLFILPKLLNVFGGSANEDVGRAMVEGMQQVEKGLGNISLYEMEKILASYPLEVKDMAVPLLEKIKDSQSERLMKLETLEANLTKGDVGQGRKLFYGKAICSTCHAIGSEGSDFGPDLSNIGEIRSRHDILEALVYPSASFAREYNTYEVKTSKETYQGIIKEQTGKIMRLKIAPGSEVFIPQDEIVSIKEQSVSLMPPGLEQQLTKEELSHLLAFLEALPYDIDRLIELKETE